MSIPRLIDLRWVVSDAWQIGVNARLQGNQYKITQSDAIDTLKYSVGTAGAVIAIGGDSGLVLTLFGGRTFLRRYETLLDDNVVESADLENNAYLEAKLALAF